MKNSFQKIMKLVFKFGVGKASIKSRKVPSLKYLVHNSLSTFVRTSVRQIVRQMRIS